MAQPLPKAADLQRLAGAYNGTFTYSGPKGRLDGTAFLLIKSRTSNRLVGRLVLNPGSIHHEGGWNCSIEIENLAIDINDAVPFDKGRTGAEGRITPSVDEGVLIFVSDLLSFKKKNIEGSVRIKWEKDGPDFDLTMTVRTHKGDTPQPTIRVSFSGSEILQ